MVASQKDIIFMRAVRGILGQFAVKPIIASTIKIAHLYLVRALHVIPLAGCPSPQAGTYVYIPQFRTKHFCLVYKGNSSFVAHCSTVVKK